MSDESDSHRSELHQFVLRSQHRLDALLETIKELRKASTGSTDQTIPLETSPLGTTARRPMNDQADDQSTSRSTRLSSLMANTVSFPNEPPSDATTFECEVDDSSAADTRLEAIKQRLARQIENA